MAIEVVSPSSAKTDRITKRRLYQEQRIPEYWVVDIDQRQVEVWLPDAAFPVVERERLVWPHPKLAEGCVVDVVKLLKFGCGRPERSSCRPERSEGPACS